MKQQNTSITKTSRFGSIDVIDKETLFAKTLKIFKFCFTGSGMEADEQRVGLLRYLSSNAIIFKIIGRFFSWRFKHTKDKHKTTLDLNKSNLREIYDYTVKQNVTQPTTGSTRRAEIYYKLLSLPPIKSKNSKLLIIGAKNVTEIFIAWLYGFKWKNIYAIDLFSLHPKIKIMSMENMTHPDSHFDCISMANVYGYNDDPMPAFFEISRVIKTGGMFSFNSVYQPNGKTKTYRMTSKNLIKIFNKTHFKVIYHFQETNKDGGTGDIWLLQKNN